MELILYIFSKRKNSTARPISGGISVNVNLKTGTNVLAPIFLLNGDIEEYQLFNYAKWNDRYYFISNITLERNDLLSIQLTMDSLATYKSEIANYTCFVERSGSLYNPMIEDSALSQTYQLLNVIHTKSDEFTNVVPSGSFLLRTTGKSNVGSSIGITTYAIYASKITEVLDFLFTDSNFDFLDDTSVKSFFNPFQYIIDCQWFPYAPSMFGNEVDTVKLGWWDSGITAFVVTEYSLIDTILISVPEPSFNDFRQYSDNYTKLSIYLPGSGYYMLNPLDCTELIRAQYIIDVATGQTQIFIDTPQDHLIGVFAGQMSTKVAIGQLTVELLESAKGFIGGIGSIVSGQIGEGINSIINGAQTALQPTQSVNGNAGNIASILDKPVIEMYRYEYGSASFATTDVGRPLMQNERLGKLSGYIKCANASLSSEALSSVKDEINNYLNGGFYYE